MSGWVASSDTLVFFVAPAHEVTDDRTDVTVRIATAADADAYAIEIGTDSPSSFRARLTGDTLCFLVESDRTIVHASWVTTGAAWTRELDRFVVAPGSSAYTYESFTRGDARGRGLYPYTLGRIRNWAAETGLRELWVAVEATNAASLRAVAKAGFEEAFRIDVSRRLGRVTLGSPEGPRADDAAWILSPSG